MFLFFLALFSFLPILFAFFDFSVCVCFCVFFCCCVYNLSSSSACGDALVQLYFRGAFTRLVFIKFYQNGKKSFIFGKKYDYHYQKTVYILSFPMCSLLLILCFKFAHRGATNCQRYHVRAHTRIEAGTRAHPRGRSLTFRRPFFACWLWVRDLSYVFFCLFVCHPRRLPFADVRPSFGRKVLKQNTVRKPQPTKCRVFNNFPNLFVVWSFFFALFGIIWDLCFFFRV